TLGSPPQQVRRIATDKDPFDPRMDYQSLLKTVRPGMEREITEEKLQERYEACLAGVQKLKAVLDDVNPDVLLIVGDDQHEQFLDDNMPIFAIYHGDEMSTVQRRAPWADSGRRPEASRSVIQGQPDLALHLIKELCGEGFDIARTNKQREGVGLGHAFI